VSGYTQVREGADLEGQLSTVGQDEDDTILIEPYSGRYR
jgi:hypothetical protein